ncbi:DEAD/DEAH box helicase [Amycolatopsis sp., V23-08]|uniref:DEAD/DEAH box helicase n=1 Tax=Amycolatopsis heterodermiae TaxID=3110235 RepID=A0ABU5RGK5_9PSEU|nr:DEAD/DEAH box helicase [Amycolatopsis sp., V23-08]MEA5365413.1 DEAD/DEAH box helicase [Amycolatopsis sp., V23-08]
MKPLITTVNALKEMATGLSREAIPASPLLFEYTGIDVEVLLHAEDTADEQRIFVIRQSDTRERTVPRHPGDLTSDVLSRVASFAERARANGSLTLPHGWHQFKRNNLITFFAGQRGGPEGRRWIAELLPGAPPDIVFWGMARSDRPAILEEFEAAKPILPPGWQQDWRSAVEKCAEWVELSKRPETTDVEIELGHLDQSTTKGWSYEQWLTEVTADQHSFIEATTTKSIRLRGPAGSGKTLALSLKAIKEVLDARESGGGIRVLMVTHSWSLTTAILESVESMGKGQLAEIDVFPLLEIAKLISPHYANDKSGYSLAADDSFSGKQDQLNEILEVLDDFVTGDWVTYRERVTEDLRARFDSGEPDDRKALAWDLLLEFGSVIGASAIFPGAGAESRYAQLPRAGWMLPLQTRDDKRVVFALYTKYMENLDARGTLTSDQVLADLLSHLETHAWNRARKDEGYDLIFVDEFHLFSPLERQVLHYLSRDVNSYPRVFMAVDPRQSPSEAFIGVAADGTRSSSGAFEASIGDVTNFELTTVHRFTPQILELIKHVHHEFPTLDLGADWQIDFAAVESAQESGPLPVLSKAASREGEDADIAKAVHKLYSTGRIALAVVDNRHWHRFSELATRIATSGKFHVSTISGRTDIDGIGYRSRGLVVGPAEYLAGLQFDVVLVAGIPDMDVTRTATNERTRLLSLLYLALSRAQRQVRVFVNDDDGGAAEVLGRAVTNGVMKQEQGSFV